MTSILKVQRNGLVTIPKEWRSSGFKEGHFVEAILRDDGILLHPVENRSVRPATRAGGWRTCMGGVSASVMDRLQETLEAEFSKVNLEDWK